MLLGAVIDEDSYEKALSILEDIREQGEDDFEWNYNYGLSLYLSGEDVEEACNYFVQAFNINPDDMDAQYFIKECEKNMLIENMDNKSYITLQLNAPLEIEDRETFIDALDILLVEKGIGRSSRR